MAPYLSLPLTASRSPSEISTVKTSEPRALIRLPIAAVVGSPAGKGGGQGGHTQRAHLQDGRAYALLACDTWRGERYCHNMKLVFETAMRSRRASKTTFSAGLRPSWRRGSNGVLVRELARPAVLGPHRHWAQRPLHPLCAARPGAPYPAGQVMAPSCVAWHG